MAEATIRIHETAYVDPSAILQGSVTVGAWTRIWPGVVITGSVTIGEHARVAGNAVIRCTLEAGHHVQMYDLMCIEGGRDANWWGSGGAPFRSPGKLHNPSYTTRLYPKTAIGSTDVSFGALRAGFSGFKVAEGASRQTLSVARPFLGVHYGPFEQ